MQQHPLLVLHNIKIEREKERGCQGVGMDRSQEVGGGGGRDDKENQIENQSESRLVGGDGGNTGGSKGKSCKGYLYYSSTLKSNGNNPRCIGIPRTLQKVPHYIVGQSEVEASKEGRSLVDFYYACAGYSVYVTKDDKQVTKTQLPVCMGLELLVDRRVSNTNTASAPAHVHSREDGREFPQPRLHKPAHSTGDDFLSRFTRNANLVASGVARNMRRVGNYMKESLDDILYPYRRRPK